MLVFEKDVLGVKYPLTVSEDDILAVFLQKKGKAFEIIKEFLKEAKKDENDITQIKLKELSELIAWSYTIEKPACEHDYKHYLMTGFNGYICTKCGDKLKT